MEGNTGLADKIMKKYNEEEFLQKVLSIPSVNGVDNEQEIAWFLANYLKECGVSAVVQEIDKTHANVIAMLEGKTDEKVVWNGHLDTVPYGKMSEWDTQPSIPVKKNGCIYARGASDMKSGLAAMVYVLGRMKQRGHVPRQTIYFFGTCDEEKGGIGAVSIVKENWMEDATFLLIGEPTGLSIGLAQKGCLWLKMKVSGKTSHGAYPQEGVNAIEYGMNIYEELKEEIQKNSHPLLGEQTIQVTMLHGGIVPNMTPDEAEIIMDIRTVPGQAADDIMEMARSVADNYKVRTKEQLSVKFDILNQREAIETESEQSWVKKIRKELEADGLEADYTGISYFTDASILTKDMVGIPTILFGPGEADLAHKPNEGVEVKKYLQYIRMLNRIF